MRGALGVALASCALVVSCGGGEPAPASTSQPLLAAGLGTVFDTTRDAFSLPMPGLTPAQRARFFVGNSFFNQNWVSAPASVASRDGLGPLFNARSCSSCHFKDGRSAPPPAGEPMRTMLVRVGTGERDAHGAPVGHAVYGDQIQGEALSGVPREADVVVSYEEQAGRFADGAPYSLRVPRYELRALGYGDPGALRISPRVAPALVGLGLLEAVPESDLQALADPEDTDHDGVSGRLNRVLDVASAQKAVGRFGWKAEQPSVRQQSAGALLGDMGITSPLFPAEACSPAQLECARAPRGGEPEIDPDTLDAIVSYARTLAVPARRNPRAPAVQRGERLFERARCGGCHRAELETGDAPDLPALSRQRIHAYTDLLLHDMGDALSDARPSFEADGREWRTPPLWGVGLVATVNGHTQLLHDGRARNLVEAVLWHGGEAEGARQQFVAMSADERNDLVAFLESL